jgi:hypothetical protein
MTDIFRPRTDPARLLYDVFQAEAALRTEKHVDQWIIAERMAMWTAARDYAQQHGLRVPTLVDVERAESCACGHVDYGSKWAYGIAEAMRAKP